MTLVRCICLVIVVILSGKLTVLRSTFWWIKLARLDSTWKVFGKSFFWENKDAFFHHLFPLIFFLSFFHPLSSYFCYSNPISRCSLWSLEGGQVSNIVVCHTKRRCRKERTHQKHDPYHMCHKSTFQVRMELFDAKVCIFNG